MNLSEWRQLNPRGRLQYLATLPLRRRRILEDIVRKQYADEQSRYVEIKSCNDEDVKAIMNYLVNEKKKTPYEGIRIIKRLPRSYKKWYRLTS